jgi:hypothetical protein
MNKPIETAAANGGSAELRYNGLTLLALQNLDFETAPGSIKLHHEGLTVLAPQGHLDAVAPALMAKPRSDLLIMMGYGIQQISAVIDSIKSGDASDEEMKAVIYEIMLLHQCREIIAKSVLDGIPGKRQSRNSMRP